MKHLELTVDDLNPPFQKQVPDHPRFFHFNQKISPVKFQESDSIVFKQKGKPDYVIKAKK